MHGHSWPQCNPLRTELLPEVPVEGNHSPIRRSEVLLLQADEVMAGHLRAVVLPSICPRGYSPPHVVRPLTNRQRPLLADPADTPPTEKAPPQVARHVRTCHVAGKHEVPHEGLPVPSVRVEQLSRQFVASSVPLEPPLIRAPFPPG